MSRDALVRWSLGKLLSEWLVVIHGTLVAAHTSTTVQPVSQSELYLQPRSGHPMCNMLPERLGCLYGFAGCLGAALPALSLPPRQAGRLDLGRPTDGCRQGARINSR